MTPSKLTEARKTLGLSQVALAEVLGIHPTIVNRWERGRAKIPPYLELAVRHLDQYGCVDFNWREWEPTPTIRPLPSRKTGAF